MKVVLILAAIISASAYNGADMIKEVRPVLHWFFCGEDPTAILS
jgi:hypothetical protein